MSIIKPQITDPLRLGHWSTRGLEAAYAFNQAGDLVDSSLNRYHGVITGATWSGDRLFFDYLTDADVVMLPALANVGQEATLIFDNVSFASDGGDGQSQLVNCNGTSIYIRVDATCRIYRDYSETGGIWSWSQSFPFSLKQLAIVLPNSTATPAVYYDLVSKTLSTTSAPEGSVTPISNATAIAVGSNTSPAAIRTIDGYIGGLKIYSRCLSFAEIAELHRNPYLPWQALQWELFAGQGGEAPAGLSIPVAMHHYNQLRCA